MPFDFPETRISLANRARADVRGTWPASYPFLAASYIDALIVAVCGRHFDLYTQLKTLIKELFPNTASKEYLKKYGDFRKAARLAPTVSSGKIVLTGTAGTFIPSGTQFQSVSGVTYQASSDATLAVVTANASSVTRTGSTVTVTTATAHGLASGLEVTIAGASQTAYNGTFEILVTNLTQFMYTLATGLSPASPATGTVTLSYTGSPLSVVSIDTGLSSNLPSGSELTVTTPISGLDNTGLVDFSELSGGTDEENYERWRGRVLKRWTDPIAMFTKAQIEQEVMALNFVDRVFVQQATPIPGEVTVYFTSVNTNTGIPTGEEVSKVLAALLAIKPAGMEDSDVNVYAPTAVPVNFTFTALSPSTEAMREAIMESLEQSFRVDTQIGVNLQPYTYQSAIYKTSDKETGTPVESFTLSSPSGAITVGTGSIATLGTITFS